MPEKRLRLKRGLCLAAAVLMALCLCACGKKPAEPDDPYAEVPVSYTPMRAEHEDEALSLSFAHAFTKTSRSDTAHTGRDTYQMHMAKNEIEGCEFLLSAPADRRDLTCSVSAFTNGSVSLKTEVFRYEYFYVNYAYIPDAAVPLAREETFTVKGGESGTFLIQVTTDADTPAGDYQAQLELRDAAGRQIKVAKVFLHVWDFALPEATSNTVSVGLTSYDLAVVSGRSDLYQVYYDFLLENRICAYNLPFDLLEQTEQAAQYLNNPRVRSFNAGMQRGFDVDEVSRIAALLRENPVWAEKAYFYYVDEPLNEDMIRSVGAAGQRLSQVYPEYRMVSPFYLNGYLQRENMSYMDYLAQYINIWCPKPELYTTHQDNLDVSGTRAPFLEGQEQDDFYLRMMQEKAGGDTLWWYTCWGPTAPYITLNTEEKGVNHRILFWQQKYFDVDGFLYYGVNCWNGFGDSWNSHEQANADGNMCWGDGQLLYCGTQKGLDVPVASLRLYALRDGVEDFEYLTMLEQRKGSEEVKELISKVTSSVVKYNSDEDFFASYRVRLGNYLQAVIHGNA